MVQRTIALVEISTEIVAEAENSETRRGGGGKGDL
jgi:hypothetical protein